MPLSEPWSIARPAASVSPLMGVVADSGLIARLSSQTGVDFLMALSAGVFRSQGVTPLAAFLPFGNSNDLTETLCLDHVLPACGPTPVIAGLLASDPTRPIVERLERLRGAGVAGVVNYPSVCLLDGSMKAAFEAEGCTVEAEIEMLAQARKIGLGSVGFVDDEPATARKFAESGIDALIMTPGLTRSVGDIHERRDQLAQAIRRLNMALRQVRKVRVGLPCLVFGGPITLPEDLDQVYRRADFDGFVGGSVIGRFPIESGVTAAIRRFKGVVLQAEGHRPSGLGPMIGATDVMNDLFRLIRRAAACDLNVCVEGESGVGKELVATHIHALSNRSHGALVTLNCGAIPDSLLESELFGHERGAFTGADHRRLGKFELAHDGTLFLDEIGDLSPRAQVALLRAIQQREITRVGGNASIPVNIRVLAASNQSLLKLVEQGRFRADLHYRLNNLTLTVPPLRDRLDDIPLLIEPIMAGLKVQMSRELTGISPEFQAKMRKHAWRGNLRELQHVLAQAALLEDGPILEGWQFTPSGLDRGIQPVASQASQARRAVEEARGNKSRAAEVLGVSRKTLYAWLKGDDEADQSNSLR